MTLQINRSFMSYRERQRWFAGTDESDKQSLEPVIYYGDYAPIVERLVKKRRAPGEELEAAGCIGAPSNFNLPFPQIEHPTIEFPDGGSDEPDDDEEEEDEEEAQALQYDEVARNTTTIRVTNPTDSDQFVDIQRINWVRFRGPDGRTHQFNLNWGS